MRPIVVDNKTVGYLAKLNGKSYVGYFNSKTPDSPFSNFYQPNKPIDLYVGQGKLSAKPFAGGHHGLFTSVEQIFAFGKAETFGDKRAAAQIYNTRGAYGSVYKRLGRSVQNYNDQVWQQQAPIWMKVGIQAKANSDPFTQKAFNHIAKNNDHVQFVECNPYDRVWGGGVNLADGFSNFRGQNKQGQLVTNVFEHMPQLMHSKQTDGPGF